MVVLGLVVVYSGGGGGDWNSNMSQDREVRRHDMDLICCPFDSPGQGLPGRQGQDLGSHQQSHRRRAQGFESG